MTPVKFLGIDVDEVKPCVTFRDTLSAAEFVFRQNDTDLLIYIRLSGTGSAHGADSDGNAAYLQTILRGEARLRLMDITTEKCPLSSKSADEVSFVEDDYPSIYDEGRPSGFREILLDILTVFRPKSTKDQSEKKIYFNKLKRDDHPERPVAFLVPNEVDDTLTTFRGKKIVFEMYREEGPDYFFMLGKTWEKHHFPKIYDMYAFNPNNAAEQVMSIAKTWHEGSITSAAVALESDLEHG